MIRLRTTISGSDYSVRGAKAASKEAQDYAWKYHRSRYMHFHFKRVAFERYKEYRENKPKRRLTGRSRRRSDSRDGRTKQVREAQQREANKLRAERERRGETAAQSKLPLVRTGYMRYRVLQGPVKAAGKFDKRSLTYKPPRYAFINPPGQMDKASALNAMNEQEENDVVKKYEERFFDNLNKKRTTKRSK